MNSVQFMWAAYAAVWIIHGVYLTILVRRYRHLRREIASPPSR